MNKIKKATELFKELEKKTAKYKGVQKERELVVQKLLIQTQRQIEIRA